MIQDINRKVTFSSERVKQELKRIRGSKNDKNREFTISNLGSIIGYDNDYAKHFFGHNPRKIEFSRVQVLANFLSVRAEYLCGEDDFRTEDDIIAHANQKLEIELRHMLLALKELGFDVRIVLNASAESQYNNESHTKHTVLVPAKDFTPKLANEILQKHNDIPFKTADIDIIINNITGAIQCSDVLFEISHTGINKVMSIDQFSKFYNNIKKTSQFIFNNFY